MNRYLYVLSFLVCIACGETTQPTHTTGSRYEKLAACHKLIGHWQQTFAKGRMTENWEQTNDSVYVGNSMVVIGSDTVSSETIQLQQTENDVWYVPTVQEQNNGQPIPFLLTASSPTHLVFENPQHDFPQKITYTFFGTDSLVAEISGDATGNKQPQQFPMTRVR